MCLMTWKSSYYIVMQLEIFATNSRYIHVYLTVREAIMILRLLLMYLGIALEPDFRKINSTQ